jgi:hypothetical protein
MEGRLESELLEVGEEARAWNDVGAACRVLSSAAERAEVATAHVYHDGFVGEAGHVCHVYRRQCRPFQRIVNRCWLLSPSTHDAYLLHARSGYAQPRPNHQACRLR